MGALKASISCSSSPVPRVATTIAWVSPRVNRAEPWARGRTPTSQTIGRTVRTSRPSMREPVSRMFQRTTLAWTSLKAALTFSGSKRPRSRSETTRP